MEKIDKYKMTLEPKDFFKSWEKKNVDALSEEMKEYIYSKYLIKKEVFSRDSFKCQNMNCKTPNHKLTFHHVKFKKNGGADKPRNGVSLCRACHAGYHKAKMILVFPAASYLPPHIRGHTFSLDKPDKPDFKLVKANGKKLRNEVKMKLQSMVPNSPWFKLTLDQIVLLMNWLYTPFDEQDDD